MKSKKVSAAAAARRYFNILSAIKIAQEIHISTGYHQITNFLTNKSSLLLPAEIPAKNGFFRRDVIEWTQKVHLPAVYLPQIRRQTAQRQIKCQKSVIGKVLLSSGPLNGGQDDTVQSGISPPAAVKKNGLAIAITERENILSRKPHKQKKRK